MKKLREKLIKEDQCKGAFWEGRFKSQALLDEQALLSCMMYVDLNPIRAGVTSSLDQSDFTSIQQRIREHHQTKIPTQQSSSNTSRFQLLPFIGGEHQAKKAGVNFAFADYLELIDWTGRYIRNDKKGFITPNQPKILQQLGITADAWLEHSEQFMEHYANVSGRWSRMCAFKQRIGGHWCKGKLASHQLHPN
ncbi:Mobile element protein [Photobacterium piscicola]|uniref:Mobile element protein n=1 Tax=Photobacterium piscicola TaxID=1378299 RepID=UPI0037353AE2